MAYTSWRGVIGCVKPTRRPGATEDLIRILPEGIGVIPLYLDIRSGAFEDWRDAVPSYEPKVAELAEQGCDVVLPEGAGGFMARGYKGELALIRSWEKKYKTQIFTSGMNHVRALKALKIKRFACVRPGGATGFDEAFESYFREAGFDPVGFFSLGSQFNRIGQISDKDVYGVAKKAFLSSKGCDGIYFLGSAMRVGAIIEAVEQDLGVPVVSALTARCWEVQKRLNVRQPVPGFGTLLREMP